jgi:probable F420-dependent oxidoreductase
VTRLELGSIGVVVGSPGDGDVFVDAATELAGLGYSTIWLAGPQIQSLEQIGHVVRATRNVQIASGVISVDHFEAAAVAAAYAEIDAKHPGRFIVGLGGAHGPKPLQTLAGYLDALDTGPPAVPEAARVLAALGPRMLHLARDRAAGAYPLLVTPTTPRRRVRCWARTLHWLSGSSSSSSQTRSGPERSPADCCAS